VCGVARELGADGGRDEKVPEAHHRGSKVNGLQPRQVRHWAGGGQLCIRTLQQVSGDQARVEDRHRIETDLQPGPRHNRRQQGAEGDAGEGGKNERSEIAAYRARERPRHREQGNHGERESGPGCRNKSR